MIDQAIFENLQTKIDEETTVRDVSLTHSLYLIFAARTSTAS